MGKTVTNTLQVINFTFTIDTVQVLENSAVCWTTVTLNGGINTIIIYRN